MIACANENTANENTANYCYIHANECMLITLQHCVSSYTSRVLSNILSLEGNLYI